MKDDEWLAGTFIRLSPTFRGSSGIDIPADRLGPATFERRRYERPRSCALGSTVVGGPTLPRDGMPRGTMMPDDARLLFLAPRIVERHLVVPAAMGGRRAAESGDDDLRENLAVVHAVHRQAGDELLRTRSGETKTLKLLRAPRGLARRLHRRRQQRCVTDRQDLLRVEQLADFCS